jgi:Zn-dependent protease
VNAVLGGEFDLTSFIIKMAVIILAITIHEFAHAIAADRLGDPTPRSQGRISLLPPDHLDPVGTVMMVVTSLTGVGIGWGKPVMINPRNFRDPVRDQALVSIAGPASNIVQAAVFAVLLRSMGGLSGTGMLAQSSSIVMLLLMGVMINLSLAFFNLIPIMPLDGSWIMLALLPRELAVRYHDWMRAYGPMVFLGLVLLAPGVIGAIIGPPVGFMARLMLGSI